MKKEKDQLYRQWALLQKIPVRPGSKTAQQLTDELNADGYTVSKRTVERDLSNLKLSPFAVTSDEKGIGNNPNKWFFERDTKLHVLPAMTTQMAFTLLFSEKILKEMLPPAVLKPMDTIFKKANKTLKSSSNTYRHWEKYIKHSPRTLPLLPARLSPNVLDSCLDAILSQNQLSITYKPRYDEQREYLVNPLGLVYRDGVVYLVCTFWDYTDIKQMALHRISALEILEDSKGLIPPGFDLDEYITRDGAFLYERTPVKMIKLELNFDIYTAQHLEETPLSEDQKIIYKDDYCLVRATLMDTMQLRWWILGFGENVEVIKPKKLRNEFKKISQNMQALYK